MKSIYLGVLLTCFNRRNKTLSSLNALFASVSSFNHTNVDQVLVDVFLTDDGCTDGTAQSVIETFNGKSIHIIQSDGNAYWAGGMRMAWNAAIKAQRVYDFYLLLNDDTIMKKDCIYELLKTNDFSIATYGKAGVYTGFTSAFEDENIITYGAKIYKNGLWGGAVDLKPIGIPQDCSMPNANILLVAKCVSDVIGILSSDFIHGAADWDYGIRAKQAGFPVLTSSSVCGYCAFDHDIGHDEEEKIKRMTIKERVQYLNRPTQIYVDGLTFNFHHSKLKFILMKIAYYINIYLPSFYYAIFKKRGH